MGLSELTRYQLFYESGELINNANSILNYRDARIVQNMYFDSANLIRGFEDMINSGSDREIQRDDYLGLFNQNAANLHDSQFAILVENQILSQMEEKERKKPQSNSFTLFFRFLIKAISDYQESIINSNFMGGLDIEVIRADRTQTFLSYAYYDKGLTQALFNYFWLRSGFLYVNWMWSGANANGSVTKAELEKALHDSSQLLFLRTTNSELRIQGNNNMLRQWCAWEIGNYYTKNKHEKFYTSFYDKVAPRNDLLDTFSPMKEVVNGKIIKGNRTV